MGHWWVPVAPGTGRQKRLNVPICPVRSPEAIHPCLPFVRPRSVLPSRPSCRPIQTTSPYHLTPPETVTRKKLTDRTRRANRSLFVVAPNEFIRGDPRERERNSLVFAAFFLKDPPASRFEILQLKSVDRTSAMTEHRIESEKHYNSKKKSIESVNVLCALISISLPLSFFT